MSVPLLVGEAPGRHVPGKGVAVGAPPLVGRVGAFLSRLYGVPGPLSDHFDLANVLDYYPTGEHRPRPRGGAPFPLAKAAEGLNELYHRNERRVAVMLGRRIPQAMNVAGPPLSRHGEDPPMWYEWSSWRTWLWVTIPHPSGLNRLYNDPEHKRLAREALEQAAEIATMTRPEALRVVREVTMI